MKTYNKKLKEIREKYNVNILMNNKPLETQMKNTLPTFILAILNFAVSQPNTLESENKIYLIDYHARLYAKQNDIDYENLHILESDFSDSTPQQNALQLAHNFTNPNSQAKTSIKINLIACKSFLKSL